MENDVDIAVDVLLIGGGIQGLMVLRKCLEVGWKSTLIVTRNPLGTGETLHSHGYDLRGYLLSSDASEFAQQLANSSWWQQWSSPPGSTYAGDSPTYYGVSTAGAEERRATWRKSGLPFEECAELPPALQGGTYAVTQSTVFKTQNRMLPPWRILMAISQPLQGNIAQGELTGISLDETERHIKSCQVKLDGRERTFSPKLVVLAAGRDNQRLLKAIKTSKGEYPFAKQCSELHLVRYIPMLLLKGNLPDISGSFTDIPIMIASHPCDDGERMWIVTLTENQRTTRNDVNSLEEPAVEPQTVQQTISKLCRLVPSVKNAIDTLRFSFYLGGKVDHPETKPTWFSGDLGISNLRFVWPVFWSLAETASQQLVQGLSQLPATATFPASSPFRADRYGIRCGLPVGEEKRLSSAQRWHSWNEFRALYSIAL
jgi:hypothetical protein